MRRRAKRKADAPSARAGALRRGVIAAALILAGAGLMAYPFVSNYLYEHEQQKVLFNYQQQTETMDSAQRDAAFADADRYNAALRESHFTVTDPFDPDAVDNRMDVEYEQLLNPSGDGLMGYLEIPVISVYLPIYHGTSDYVLQNGVGHLENTSLPVGGEGTHAVLSAHSGLSDKKLFTDLSLLVQGDTFYLHVMDRTLAYQVDRIETVLPHETDDLRIVAEKDFVTLVTCTPYGINSHRLLVRGTAVPYVPEQHEAEAQLPETRSGSVWMRQYAQAMCAGLLVLAAIVLAVLWRRWRQG